MPQNLVIGASHAQWMALAIADFQADWEAANRGLVSIDDHWKMLFVTQKSQCTGFRAGPHGLEAVVTPSLLQELAPFDTPQSQVICMVGGNEHNAKFMAAHAQPFDLFHPRGPAPKAGRQVVPRRVVHQTFVEALAFSRLQMLAFARLMPNARRYVVAPPPPIASEAQIRSFPEIFDFTRVAVEDAGVRLKVYETMLDVLAAIADECGCTFMPPPPANRDAQGFLAEPYWNYATHAKPAYYLPVLAELAELAGPAEECHAPV